MKKLCIDLYSAGIRLDVLQASLNIMQNLDRAFLSCFWGRLLKHKHDGLSKIFCMLCSRSLIIFPMAFL